MSGCIASVQLDDRDAGTAQLHMFVLEMGYPRHGFEVLSDDLPQHAGACAMKDTHP